MNDADCSLMTHGIGAADEVHASAGLSPASKGKPTAANVYENRAESEVLKRAQTRFPG